MKKITWLFGIILGLHLPTLVFGETGGYVTTENYNHTITYVAVTCWREDSKKQDTGFGFVISGSGGIDSAQKQARDDCISKLGGSGYIVDSSGRDGCLYKELPDTKGTDSVCGIYGFKFGGCANGDMIVVGNTQTDAINKLNNGFYEHYRYPNPDYIQNAGNRCISGQDPAVKESLMASANANLKKPQIELTDFTLDYYTGKVAKENGTVGVYKITDIDNSGSQVRYSCVVRDTEVSEPNQIPMTTYKKSDYSPSLSNGCNLDPETLLVYVSPKWRGKLFEIKAQRLHKQASSDGVDPDPNKAITRFSNLVKLGNMCGAPSYLENGACFKPPAIPSIMTPEIKIVRDSSADGSKLGILKNMTNGAKYEFIVTNQDGNEFQFSQDDYKIQPVQNFGDSQTLFTVKKSLDGKFIAIKGTKTVTYDVDKKKEAIALSNKILLKDTAAEGKQCTYTNITHSKDGTFCYPYPSCDTPTANDFISASLRAGGKNGGGIVELLFKINDISLNRSIEVLNFENKTSESIKQGLPVSDDPSGKAFIKVTDDIVSDPKTTHYDYLVRRTCENGKTSDQCKVRVYTNGSATICGDQQ